MIISEAFSSYSVDDIQKALTFYKETLGLPATTIPEGISLKLAGTSVFIYPKQAEHMPATFTVLNLKVENIEQAVDELTSKGITFEQYQNEYLKTDPKGISRSDQRAMAWFKDPAGNFLALIEE